MNADTYRFKIGALECVAVNDGTHTYTPPLFPPPPAFLFANAPKESLEPVLRQHDLPEQWTEWVSPFICLVVNTGKHLVLVDTGADAVGSNTGKLLQNLRAAGFAPGDIDIIMLSHGHPDHIGGNTDDDGKLVFPEARYVMWKDEWDFWTSGEAENKFEEPIRDVPIRSARKNLSPIRDKLDVVDQEEEVVPGIRAIAAPGHTPGQMALSISSGDEQLLCVVDLALHPIHLEHPEWCAAIDLIPEQAVATRRRLLSRAAAEKALVLAFHFPFPGLGHVVPKGEAWKWQPLR